MLVKFSLIFYPSQVGLGLDVDKRPLAQIDQTLIVLSFEPVTIYRSK